MSSAFRARIERFAKCPATVGDELREGLKTSSPARRANLAEIHRRKIANLETGLDDPTGPDEAARVLRSPVDAVVL